MQAHWALGVTYVVATLFATTRFAGKLTSKRLGWDDALLGAVILLLAIPVGLFCYSASIGFAGHLWDLEHGRLAEILRLYLVSLAVYTFAIGMIKIPVILFYLEIFQLRSFIVPAYIVLAFIITSTIVLIFVTIFACTPVAAFWDRDIKGKCMNIQAIAYATSASAIIQDLMLLVLPLVFISNLQMKRSRKITVGLMFAVGTFGCIATFIRLHALLKYKVTLDPTWDYVTVVIWTELELCATVVCISLPSIRVLLVKILPRQFKDWLTNVTRSSRRSRNGDTPKPAMPGPWKQPSSSSWVKIPHKGGGRDGSLSSHKGGKSWLQITAMTAPTSSTRQVRDVPQRSGSGVLATCPPKDTDDQIELLEVENSVRVTQPARCYSSEDKPH